MPRRDSALLLQDILIEIEVIKDWLATGSLDETLADPLPRRGLLYAIQTIGEAAAKLPAERRARFPAIPWAAIVHTRHVVVHGYADVDLGAIGRTIVEDLPTLEAALRAGGVTIQSPNSAE